MLAKAAGTSLLVTIRPTGPIRLVVSLPVPPPERPSVRFSGPAGQWSIQGGGPAGRLQAVFPLPRNDAALGRILILLSGGTLAIGPSEAGLPILSLPESGAEGQQWFLCARHSVTGM